MKNIAARRTQQPDSEQRQSNSLFFEDFDELLDNQPTENTSQVNSVSSSKRLTGHRYSFDALRTKLIRDKGSDSTRARLHTARTTNSAWMETDQPCSALHRVYQLPSSERPSSEASSGEASFPASCRKKPEQATASDKHIFLQQRRAEDSKKLSNVGLSSTVVDSLQAERVSFRQPSPQPAAVEVASMVALQLIAEKKVNSPLLTEAEKSFMHQTAGSRPLELDAAVSRPAVQLSHSSIGFGELRTGAVYAFILTATNLATVPTRFHAILEAAATPCEVSCRAGPGVVAPGMQWQCTVFASSSMTCELKASLCVKVQTSIKIAEFKLPVSAAFAPSIASQPSGVSARNGESIAAEYSHPHKLQILLDELNQVKLHRGSNRIGKLAALAPKAHAIRSRISTGRTHFVANRNMHHVELDRHCLQADHPALPSARLSKSRFKDEPSISSAYAVRLM